MQDTKIFFAKNISEALYQIKNAPGLKIIGGATLQRTLFEKTLCAKNIAELKAISRHELYLDFGPAVTLNEILDLGEERVPKVLHEAALSVANHFVRNMATLGGNICAEGFRGTLCSPLLALNATLKFRNTENQSVLSIPLEKFSGVPEKNLLTQIRVPNEDWDVSIFSRTGPAHTLAKNSASFCFLAKTEKSSLVKTRMVFAGGGIVFFSRELENKLLGVRLPISEKAILDFSSEANKTFAEKNEEQDSKFFLMMKTQFLNLTRFALNQLT